MTEKKKSLFIICILILVAIIITVAFSSSDGDDPESYTWETSSDSDKVASGRFYAQFQYRDDLHQADVFQATVKVHPALAEWPGVEVKAKDRIFSTEIECLIEIRGISVPDYHADRSRPISKVDRELQRFDDAMDFLWKLLSEADYLILESPESLGDASPVYRCDVYLEIAGAEVSLAQAMIHAGHARPLQDWDWGAKHVERR